MLLPMDLACVVLQMKLDGEARSLVRYVPGYLFSFGCRVIGAEPQPLADDGPPSTDANHAIVHFDHGYE
ncbi:hypothetical protein [Caulobacter sp. DWR1-3-2b1]|uniref:hypothetical protein n=1 Tax=Caulobacter sp. DWR1-3-2b1 TaxID=2804670 RepID=UPI003CEFB2F0